MEIDDNIFQAIQACWTGKASPEQIELVRDWLDTSPKNQDLFERLSKTHYQLAHAQIWKRINSLQGKEKLNFRFLLSKATMSRCASSKQMKETDRSQKRNLRWNTMRRAAAAAAEMREAYSFCRCRQYLTKTVRFALKKFRPVIDIP